MKIKSIAAICKKSKRVVLYSKRNIEGDIVQQYISDGKTVIPEIRTDYHDGNYNGEKPEGVAVELADCLLRILDYCGYAGIDIEEALRLKHEYNKTRSYRHGGKKC